MTAAMKPSEALRKARELITPEGAWGKGWFAFDIRGKTTNEYSDDAVCFCSVGALRKAIEPRIGFAADQRDIFDPCTYLSRVMHADVPTWNDYAHRTQAEVLAKFDEAAALAESEGA